jgi:hypothetical protein
VGYIAGIPGKDQMVSCHREKRERKRIERGKIEDEEDKPSRRG